MFSLTRLHSPLLLGDYLHERGLTVAGPLLPGHGTSVEDLARRGVVDGVVLTFYCTFLKDDALTLEVYESCLPAQAFGSLGPVPLRTVERRVEHLPPP